MFCSKALLGLSSCPEAFFALRSRFVLSHATLCVAHWVLGVGDRHLGNFLVSTNTGLEIGIDFGYAFGLTAQASREFSLMPFRLSPQYLGLLEPLGKEGPLASAMQDALRALRAGAESILDVLDVFVQEPTVDWMVRAFSLYFSAWAREVSLDWFPRQKVSIVRQKLEGGHPSYILRQVVTLCQFISSSFFSRDELKLRKTNQPDFAKTAYYLLQVDCLLEQATDPAILGLTWTGWEPWL
ncbi:mDNApk3', putative [Ixodes scapularis]|uniref:non-specific serine/threonine protein kinase n=1 Tax=Ixodes scapularis TaxID=6945 RepID=B7PA39_IXOSC|nr:mDNApk3', putative [Ixodes scapularis]|eukprot:XP_002406184.1 mDNApk3', putative [Ixodes scapularis]